MPRVYANDRSSGVAKGLLVLLAFSAVAAGFFSHTPTPSPTRYPWRSHSPSPSPSTSPSAPTYPLLNVFDFGAVGDGVHNDTDAIQGALDACTKFDGCTVWLPFNGTYLCYPISISSDNTDLKIDGEVLLPLYSDAEKYWYQNEHGYRPWLVLNNDFKAMDSVPNWDDQPTIFNITIRGFGRINGQGGSGWWTEDHNSDRPFLLYLSNAQNITLQDLTLYEAPYMHVIPYKVDGMDVHNVTIMTDAISPNTDGIDPTFSNNIHIHNTTISNGDDCIAVKTNSTNILVENCTFYFGHGASIGSTAGFSSNITFRNIVFYNTSYGARVKSRNYDTGAIYNVTYDNLELHYVRTAVQITQFYKPSNDPEANNTITDISISNMIAYDTTDETFYFNCSDNYPCVNIRLHNITSVSPLNPKKYLDSCVSFHASVSRIEPPINGTVKGALNCEPINPEYLDHFEGTIRTLTKTDDIADERNRITLVQH
eukprot:TRINITY_DN4697_c0_g2_i1.p1 TRINITY_DN4697_c0_g2~~TRINITY_DN4697_c0_g2_i1.p1  ORF type:complete len:496 (+),score=72.39 TRINITY_DN4697_c0_g2_i1:44-1489(+)